MTRWWRALLIQGMAWLAAFISLGTFNFSATVLAALLAVAGSLLLQEPWWRAPLQGFFALGVGVTQGQPGLPPSVWLALLVISALLFGAGVLGRRRAPLYLTHGAAQEALLLAIPEGVSGPCLDVGAGLGSFMALVAPHRPRLQLSGVERAPLTCLLGNLRCRLQKIGKIRWGNLWTTPFAHAAVLYAFLSPEAMPDLWQKACQEMAPNSLVIVHAFQIPGVTPEASFKYGDHPTAVIYRYRISPRSPSR